MPDRDVKTVQVKATVVDATGKEASQETVCREMALRIIVNSVEAVTVLCTPADLRQLVTGMLLAEDMIKEMADIKKIDIDCDRQTATVELAREVDNRCFLKPLITSGGGKGATAAAGTSPVTSDLAIAAESAIRLMEQFLSRSAVYSSTRGVHSAALVKNGEIAIFKDDIGRHNALDKVFGQCLEKGLDTYDGAVLLSGRISSEMLLKVARRGVPILITKAVPTDMGIQLAEKLGITIVRATKDRVFVYTHDWRINQWPTTVN